MHQDIEEHDRITARKFAAKQLFAILKFAKIDLEKDFYGLMAKFYAFAVFSSGIAVKTFLHYTIYIMSILLFSD